MRRYRAEILLFLSMLAICALAVRALSEDAKKPELKPGDEVKATELELATAAKYRAQIGQFEAQKAMLQVQFGNVMNLENQTQKKLAAQMDAIRTRLKKANGVDVVFDPNTGEDGTFRVTQPEQPAPAKK
jgi:hypothetical protein